MNFKSVVNNMSHQNEVEQVRPRSTSSLKENDEVCINVRSVSTTSPNDINVCSENLDSLYNSYLKTDSLLIQNLNRQTYKLKKKISLSASKDKKSFGGVTNHELVVNKNLNLASRNSFLPKFRVSTKHCDAKRFVKNREKLKKILESRASCEKRNRLDDVDMKIKRLTLQGFISRSSSLDKMKVLHPQSDEEINQLLEELGQRYERERDESIVEPTEEEEEDFANSFSYLQAAWNSIPDAVKTLFSALFNVGKLIVSGFSGCGFFDLIMSLSSLCKSMFPPDSIQYYIKKIGAAIVKFYSYLKHSCKDFLKDFSIRNLLEDFQIFMLSKFYKSFMRLLSYIMSLQICSFLKMKFNNTLFGKVFDFHWKDPDAKKSEKGLAFIPVLLDLTIYLFDVGSECYASQSFSPIVHDVKTYRAWSNDVKLALFKHVQWKNQGDVETQVLFDILLKLRNTGAHMAQRIQFLSKNSKKREEVVGNFYKAYREIEVAYLEVLNSIKGSTLRCAPYVIQLVGDSSIGKSSLTNFLHKINCDLMGCPTEGTLWQMTPDDQFCTGLKNSSVTCLMDDPTALRSKFQPNGDTMLRYLIAFGNNEPYGPPMASLEEKNNTQFNCSMILIPTNNESLDIPIYFQNEWANRRRIHSCIRVHVKSKYRGENGTLDSSKAFADNITDEFDDLWEFEEVCFYPQGRHAEDYGIPQAIGGYEVKKTRFKDFESFRLEITRRMHEHRNQQKALIIAQHSRTFNYQSCPVCYRMLKTMKPGIAICQCNRCSKCNLLLDQEAPRGRCVCSMLPQGDFQPVQMVFTYFVKRQIDKWFKETLSITKYYTYIFFFSWFLLSLIFRDLRSVIIGQVALFICAVISVSFAYVYTREKRRCTLQILGSVPEIDLLSSQTKEKIYMGVKIGVVVSVLVGLYKLVKHNSLFQQGQSLTKLEEERTGLKEYWPVEQAPQYRLNMSPASWSLKTSSAESFINLISRNIALVYFLRKDGSRVRSHCLFIGGQYGLMSNHCVPDDIVKVDVIEGEEDSNVYSSSNYRDHGFTESKSTVIRKPMKDLAIVRFPFIRSKRRIDKFFPVRDFTDNILDAYLITRCKDTFKLLRLHESKVRHTVWPNNRGIPAGTSVYIGQSNRPTQNGDCGGLVFVRTIDGISIIGIHTAMTQDMEPATNAVSQELLQSFNLPLFDVNNIAHVSQSQATPQAEIELRPLSKHAKVKYMEGEGEIYGSSNVPPKKYKSKVCKTPFYDFLPPDEDIWSVPEMNRGLVYVNAIGPAFKPSKNWNLALVDECLDEIFSHAINESDDPLLYFREYSVHECINGLPGVPFMNSVNRKSAMGAPFSGSKQKFIVKLPPDETYQDPITFTKEVMDEIECALYCYRNNICYNPLYRVTPKDEVVTKSKVERAKNRMYAVGPTAGAIAAETELQGFMRWYQVNNRAWKHSIGVRAQTQDWHDMMKGFIEHSPYHFSGDYSLFDKKQNAGIIMMIGYRIAKMYRDLGFPLSEPRILCIFHDIAFATYECRGDIYSTRSQNPSGGFLTTIVNTIYNELCGCYSFKLVYPKLNFFAYIDIRMLGDDIIVSVSAACLNFNFMSMKRAMLQVGTDFQPAAKDGSEYHFQPWDEMIFLKRETVKDDRFMINGEHLWISRLSLVSLMKMLYWHVASDCVPLGEQMASTVNSFLREIYFHGDAIFDEWSVKLREWMIKCDFEAYIIPSTFPTHSDLQFAFFNKGLLPYAIEEIDCSNKSLILQSESVSSEATTEQDVMEPFVSQEDWSDYSDSSVSTLLRASLGDFFEDPLISESDDCDSVDGSDSETEDTMVVRFGVGINNNSRMESYDDKFFKRTMGFVVELKLDKDMLYKIYKSLRENKLLLALYYRLFNELPVRLHAALCAQIENFRDVCEKRHRFVFRMLKKIKKCINIVRALGFQIVNYLKDYWRFYLPLLSFLYDCCTQLKEQDYESAVWKSNNNWMRVNRFYKGIEIAMSHGIVMIFMFQGNDASIPSEVELRYVSQSAKYAALVVFVCPLSHLFLLGYPVFGIVSSTGIQFVVSRIFMRPFIKPILMNALTTSLASISFRNPFILLSCLRTVQYVMVDSYDWGSRLIEDRLTTYLSNNKFVRRHIRKIVALLQDWTDWIAPICSVPPIIVLKTWCISEWQAGIYVGDIERSLKAYVLLLCASVVDDMISGSLVYDLFILFSRTFCRCLMQLKFELEYAVEQKLSMPKKVYVLGRTIVTTIIAIRQAEEQGNISLALEYNRRLKIFKKKGIYEFDTDKLFQHMLSENIQCAVVDRTEFVKFCSQVSIKLEYPPDDIEESSEEE